VEQAPHVPEQASSVGGRNFTGPVQPVQPRRPSFEKGDERRVFSTGSHPPTQQVPESTARVVSAASAAPTETSEVSSINPQNRRDFSSAALPNPLQTSTNAPITSPLRSPESIVSPGVRSPSAGVYDPRSTTPTGSTKALPFIRPADIYKRMEEAREQERRASMESSNSGQEEPRGRSGSTASMQKSSLERLAQEHSRAEKPALASVPERRSEYGMLDKVAPITQTQPSQVEPSQVQPHPAQQSLPQQTQPQQSLPQQTQPRLSQPQYTSSQPNYPAAKIPPQPRQSFDLPKYGAESNFSDEFWGSTTQIGGLTGAKGEALQATTVSPTTVEAPSRNPSQGFRTMVTNAFHAADSSGVSKQDSIKSYGTSAGASDISPILQPIQEVSSPEPDAIQLTPQETKEKELPLPPHATPSSTIPEIYSLPTQPSNYERQNIMKPLPVPTAQVPGHSTDRPMSRGEILSPPPRIGSRPSSPASSPSKGMARDLALHLGDKSSRRSSVISVGSKTSAAEFKIAESPKGQVAEIVNPQSTASELPKESTDLKRRPSMPGQFDSYALDSSELPTPAPDPQPMREIAERALAGRVPKGQPNETPELAPTTAVRKLEGKEVPTGAMANLAAAGAAMGDAIRRSLTIDRGDKAPDLSSSNKQETGDILSNKPLAPQRLESEASRFSTIPPTPPDKDDTPPPAPLKPSPLVPSSAKKSPLEASRPVQNTTGASNSPAKVDWLRNEIDRSLTPLSNTEIEALSKEDSYAISPVSPDLHGTETVPPPLLNKKFSWESSNISASASQLDVLHSSASAVNNASPVLEHPATPDNARLNGDGLHVINSQPGELPKNATDPLFNQIDHALDDPEVTPKEKGKSRVVENVALGAGIAGAAAAVTAVTASSLSNPDHLPTPPTKDISDTRPSPTTPTAPPAIQKDILSFREIQAIKSTPDRIAMYNSNRTKWANTDEGLGNWIGSTFAKYPEHESIKQGAALPLIGSSHDSSRVYRQTAGAGIDPVAYPPETPPKDKRTSSGAGKAVAEGLRGLGGKGKGLLERMGRGRLRGSDGVGN
jgi:hypothetical protein